MGYARGITLDLPHEEAVSRVKEVFKDHGFGVLTEIDVTATLKKRIGEVMEPYTILGMCNPHMAREALDIERDIGLLLPCDVVVRAAYQGSVVRVLEPRTMVAVSGREELYRLAEQTGRQLQAVLDDLGDPDEPGDPGVPDEPDDRVPGASRA